MATNKLNEFISEVKNGVARTNQFIVELTPPRELALKKDINDALRMIVMFCDQAQLPGLSLSTAQVRSYGEFKEVPYEKLYEPIQLSFYVDNNFKVKTLFDEWMNLIQDPNDRTFNYPKDYIAESLNIHVIDKLDRTRHTVTLHKVYPKAIAAIQLDYASRDVMKLNVTLAYQYFTVKSSAAIGVNEDVPSAIESLMAKYSYGFEGVTEIPVDYFSDFSGFQNTYADYTTGIKSVLSTENIGEITGFGGIFT